MPFAKRIDHTDPKFLPTLEAEITRLLSVRNRVGVLIRLHALGDFFSVEYVEFWGRMLTKHPNLAIYGYTARKSGPIMWAIGQLYGAFQDRALIRYSDGGFPFMSTVSIGDEAGCPPNTFICPGTDRQNALLCYVRRMLVDHEKRSIHGALKMDKWDESVERIKNGMLAEEPEAALAGALQLFANFGRTLEMISADMDRIATALEGPASHNQRRAGSRPVNAD
jgi:hypothetical protein